MSAAKHTPGPWSVIAYGTHARLKVVAGSMPVATVASNNSDFAHNARLISAAPELVEALDHPLLRQLIGEIEDSGTAEAGRLWALYMQWHDVRQAALSKALGQEGEQG